MKTNITSKQNSANKINNSNIVKYNQYSSNGTYAKGVIGEKIAAEYLSKAGYQILIQRFKTKHGEIDIIAASEKKQMLLFVEIKHLKQNSHAIKSMEIITHKQIKRNCDTAQYFLGVHENQYAQYQCRFDLILLSNANIIQHIKNAWEFIEHTE
jgi:putative endonuclease